VAAGFVILPFNINISYIGIQTPPSYIGYFKSGQSCVPRLRLFFLMEPLMGLKIVQGLSDAFVVKS
jgi:hypothetical protein